MSANTLLTAINDVLDFSKIEAGKVELEAIDFNCGTSSNTGRINTKVRQEVQSRKPVTMDFKQMLEQLGGDENLLQEVIEIFVAQAPTHMETLRRALTLGDAGLVEKTAHSMKGELAYLGILEVTRKARVLEELGRKHDLEQAAQVFVSFERDISGIVSEMKKTKAVNRMAISAESGQ